MPIKNISVTRWYPVGTLLTPGENQAMLVTEGTVSMFTD
jgi:hypothetical protein